MFALDLAVERVMRSGKKIYSTVFKRWLVEQACEPSASAEGLAMRFVVNADQLRWSGRGKGGDVRAELPPAAPALTHDAKRRIGTSTA